MHYYQPQDLDRRDASRKKRNLSETRCNCPQCRATTAPKPENQHQRRINNQNRYQTFDIGFRAAVDVVVADAVDALMKVEVRRDNKESERGCSSILAS